MGGGEAPGKVILVGEHFVVHGTPALALPLKGRGIRVQVAHGSAPWEMPAHVEAHVRRLLEALGESSDSVHVRVDSDLPIGAGLGGSAALAVALVRALDGELDDEAVRLKAHELEKIAHGNPSGIDDAVAAYACPVRYVRGGTPVALRHVVTPKLWVGLTAERTSTLEAVAGVRRLAEARPEWFADLCAEAHRVAELAEGALCRADWQACGRAMVENHALLQAVEVSTPALDRLVQSAMEAGAFGAKLTGGGLGGAAIALAPPGLALGEVWQAAGATEVIAP